MTAALFSGILGALLGFFMSARIGTWLEEIREAAEGYLSGDFSRRIPAARSKELNRLVTAWNRMAAESERRIQAMNLRLGELDAILSSMVEGVIAFDTDERILTLNRKAAALFAISEDNVRLRTIQEGIRNADLQRCLHLTLLSSEPVEDEIVLLDPSERYLRVTGTPLLDGQQRRVGALLVLEDVTTVRKLENARRDFVSNVSHEIRTPVTSIKGYAETLLEGAIEEPEVARPFLETIGRQSERLCMLVDDILSLSRLERSEQLADIPFEKVRAMTLVEAAVRACAPKAERQRIRLSVSGETAPEVRVSVTLMEQAIINLVDNAIKYSEPDAEVKIDLAQSGDGVCIAVHDSGCGIAPEHLPRIFERFYRVDRARSRMLGGTGLGLAIVKHIMTVHNGSVSVESKPGHGSTFTLHLPSGNTVG